MSFRLTAHGIQGSRHQALSWPHAPEQPHRPHAVDVTHGMAIMDNVNALLGDSYTDTQMAETLRWSQEVSSPVKWLAQRVCAFWFGGG